MIDFGTGLVLKQGCDPLRDQDARIELILEVTERNSVIEGLPPLDEGFREQVRTGLALIAGEELRRDSWSTVRAERWKG